MSQQSSDNPTPENPNWMDELQDLADKMLGDLDEAAACDQVHPIIADWYDKELQKDPPESRPAIWQAMACLSTEILMDAEHDENLQAAIDAVDEDTLAMWIEHILLVGRAMEAALQRGDLDDL